LPYSMTGFGAAEGPVAGRRLRVEIRTVNHRYFNLSAKLPGDLSALEVEVRDRLRRDFDRGHVTVQARWTENLEADPEFGLDMERARLVADRLRERSLYPDGDINAFLRTGGLDADQGSAGSD